MNLKKHMTALAAASALFVGGAAFAPANAADLGGDCCADLEERVAELEATTARKGNRKVSLTISGWVARELYVWDDGDLSDAYVADVSRTLGTHFKFSGNAQMKPGVNAGFVIHIEVVDAESIFLNQENDEALGESGFNTLEAYWFIKSERFGKLSLGQLSQASDNTAILADFSGSLVQSNWVLFDGASFFLRPKGSGLGGRDGLEGNSWGGAMGFCSSSGLGIGADCNGLTRDAVRYDSPSFYGFVLSASWGENDFADVALSYAKEWNSFKFKAGAAYNWWGDNKADAVSPNADGTYFQVGAMAMHVPSGIFLYGAYGVEETDARFYDGNSAAGLQAVEADDDGDHYFIKAGIRKNWLSYGATVLYGEYGKYNDMYAGFDCDNTLGGTNIGNACAAGLTLTGSELERYGLGIVQEFDSAGMSIWAKWVQLDGEIEFNSQGASGKQDYEALNQYLFGAMITF